MQKSPTAAAMMYVHEDTRDNACRGYVREDAATKRVCAASIFYLSSQNRTCFHAFG